MNCCFSNSPTGPFHKITLASEKIDFIDSKLSGAISNIESDDLIEPISTTLPSSSGEPATTTFLGNITPSLFANSNACFSMSFSNKDEPTSKP